MLTTTTHYVAAIESSSAKSWAKGLGIKVPAYPTEWIVQVEVADQRREKAWGPQPETAHVLTLEVANGPRTSGTKFWTLKLANGSKGGAQTTRWSCRSSGCRPSRLVRWLCLASDPPSIPTSEHKLAENRFNTSHNALAP